MKSVLRSMAAAALFATSLAGVAHADYTDNAIRIVVMNDQSGAYADQGGEGSVTAARLAVEDWGGKVNGTPVEIISVDHQLKVDVAMTNAQQLLDEKNIDAFMDMSSSAVSLAIQELGRQHNKVTVHVGTAHADLYGKACSPTGALWLYDTYALAKGLSKAVLDENHKKWFILAVDYAFGHAMQQEIGDEVKSLGGEVTGSVRHPTGTSDFASYLLQAQGADVLAVLSAGQDTSNAIKQAVEFGIVQGDVKIAAPIFTILNVKSIGNEFSKGTTFLVGNYWDQDEESRAFAKRYAEKMGRAPSHIQSAVYSATNHYLKGLEAAKTDDGPTVMAKMKEIPVNDFMTKNAKLREDGRLMRDMVLVEAKKPEEVTGDWDLLKVTGHVKAEDMIRPLADGGCEFIKQ